MNGFKRAANGLSLSRVPIGGALGVVSLGRSSTSHRARVMLVLAGLGLATDLVDGNLARRSGEPASPQVDALADAALFFGLLVGTEELDYSIYRAAALAGLVPAYIGSQVVKRWLPASAIRRIDQAHFCGSITLTAVTLGRLGLLAGLHPRTVATSEALVLGVLAVLKRGRIRLALV